MDLNLSRAGDRPAVLAPGPGENHVDKIFEHFFSPKNLFSTIPHTLWGPATDVYETPDNYIVRIEIPGIEDAEKDVDIGLNHNVLTVRGCRRDRSSDTKLGFHQMEIHYGYFEKVVTLPHSIDPDTPQAVYNDGFLSVTIAKAPPRRRARRRIEIDS